MQDKNVIAYVVHRLKVCETHYPTHDLELAAVVIAFRIWWHYLYGVKCEVFTKNDMNLRQQIWMEVLKDYDVTTQLQYHLGKANVVEDT